MAKIDFIICFLILIGILVASVKMFSDKFAERLDVGKNIQTVLATILTVIASLSIAVYVEFIHYVEFVLWRFCLITFSVFSITIGISVILAIFKKQWDDRKEYRKLKKLARKTEKFISDKKARMILDSCVTVDNDFYSISDECMAIDGGDVQENNTYIVKDNLALKNNCCEMVGGKVINFEEARRKKKG